MQFSLVTVGLLLQCHRSAEVEAGFGLVHVETCVSRLSLDVSFWFSCVASMVLTATGLMYDWNRKQHMEQRMAKNIAGEQWQSQGLALHELSDEGASMSQPSTPVDNNQHLPASLRKSISSRLQHPLASFRQLLKGRGGQERTVKWFW